MMIRFGMDDLSRKARLIQDALVQDYNNQDAFSLMTYSIGDLTERTGANRDSYKAIKNTLNALIEIDKQTWWWSTMETINSSKNFLGIAG